MNYIKLNIQLFGASNNATNSDLKSSAGNKATITVSFTESDYTDTDVANNTTTVTVTGTYTQNTGNWSQISTPMLYVDWYDDERATWTNVASKNVTAVAKGETIEISGSLSVPHKDDGSLIGKARTRWVYTKSSTLVPTSGTVTTSNTTMTTIPRSNTITSTSAYIQEKPTITIGKKASSSTTTVTWSCTGNGVTKSGTIATKTSASSITDWAIPTDVYSYISSTGKTATIKLTATTYMGETSVGSENTTFTATVKEAYNEPTISLSVVDTNTTTKALTGDVNVVVLNASTMACTYNATAKNGAIIKSADINGTTLTAESTTISGTNNISKPKTNVFKLSAIDSRGFENSVTKTLTNPINYFVPTLIATIERNTPTDGIINIDCSGDVFVGSFGKSSNTFKLEYRYKKKSDTSYSAWADITPTLSGTSYSQSTQLSGFNYQIAYSVQVRVVDAINSIAKTQDIAVGRPSPWWDETNMYIDGSYYKRHDGTLIKNSTLLDSIILEPGTNLNNIGVPGVYKGYEMSTNSYSNVPVKTGTFILEVFKTPDGVIGQRYTQCRENDTNTSNVSQGTFMRFYTSNWSRWQGNASAVTYDTSGGYGWYRIFRASYLGGYANTSAIITIKSGSLYPNHLNGSIRFTQYHTSAPAVQIIEGNITPSKVKVILNSDDKTFDVFVKTTATYTSLDIFYQTSSHYAVEINPQYFGTDDNLPTASSTYSVQPPENYYRSGETLVIDGYTALPGLLTTSSKNIHFTIFTPKDMSYINSITINSYNLDIRHPSGGYIANGVTSFDGIVVTKRSPNMIDITITYNTAVSFTNNTPVSVAVNSLKLTFNA